MELFKCCNLKLIDTFHSFYRRPQILGKPLLHHHGVASKLPAQFARRTPVLVADVRRALAAQHHPVAGGLATIRQGLPVPG